MREHRGLPAGRLRPDRADRVPQPRDRGDPEGRPPAHRLLRAEPPVRRRARRRRTGRSTTRTPASASTTTASAPRRACRTRPTRPRSARTRASGACSRTPRTTSRRPGATLLMTEFGDVQDATIHRRVTELADEFMVGWTVWGWFRAAGQIKQDPAKPPTRDNLNMEVLARGRASLSADRGRDADELLVRPRDEALRGEVLDDGCRTAAARGAGGARSTSRGCTTAATTGSPSRERRSRAGSGTQRVELRACRGAKSVTVTVTDR